MPCNIFCASPRGPLPRKQLIPLSSSHSQQHICQKAVGNPSIVVTRSFYWFGEAVIVFRVQTSLIPLGLKTPDKLHELLCPTAVFSSLRNGFPALDSAECSPRFHEMTSLFSLNRLGDRAGGNGVEQPGDNLASSSLIITIGTSAHTIQNKNPK